MKKVTNTCLKTALVSLAFLVLEIPAFALELVMVQAPGCVYCEKWNEEVAPKYPKTELGAQAPLRRVEKSQIDDSIQLARPVVYTPTFLFVDDDREVHRLEGYISEDFFWALGEEFTFNYSHSKN